jgi:hypothetical protein
MNGQMLKDWIAFEPSIALIFRGLYSIKDFGDAIENLSFNEKNIFIINTSRDINNDTGHFIAIATQPALYRGILFDSFALDPNMYSPTLSPRVIQLMAGSARTEQEDNRPPYEVCPFALQSKKTSTCPAWVIFAALQFARLAPGKSMLSPTSLAGWGFHPPGSGYGPEWNDKRLLEWFAKRYSNTSKLENMAHKPDSGSTVTLAMCLPFLKHNLGQHCFTFNTLMSRPLDNE